jgi:uncharacterized protein
MPISQFGALNTTALVVPDLYVQIVPPQNLVLNGVPTNVVGIIGTASYGPVNQPVIASTAADYAAAFGPVMPRKYDMGTQLATAVQQGASNFRCVRVTDGTDTKASFAVGGATPEITYTAMHSGSLGSKITVTTSAGSKASTFRIVVQLAGGNPEVFDNLAGTGAAFWAAVESAITMGNGPLRGPSQLVTAAVGTGTAAPTLGTVTLTGGTDGATTITAAVLVGAPLSPLTGMYALAGQGVSIALLADADDSTQWTTIDAWGLANGAYMIQTGPAGDTIANAINTKATAGLDSYSTKYMFGDWIFWNDQTNGLTRLVSPQGFTAGRLANLSPNQSSLNKPIASIVASQKSGLNPAQATTYSTADLAVLFQSGIDVISNPQPGGAFWGVRCGHNSSSNAAINGDNYTRMTNFLAATLNAGMGVYVGMDITTTLLQNIRSTQLSFLQNLLQQGILSAPLDGSLPFKVVCDITNNPFSQTSIGMVQSDAQIQYQAINEKFIVNLEGGQTVTVTQATTGGTSQPATPTF